MNAGANLDAKTGYGNSILHFIARRDDNTPLLKFFLEKHFPLDLFLKNSMGENFLHIYVVSEVFENVIEIIEFISANYSKDAVKRLLNDEDIFGRAPWAYLIDTANVDKDAVLKFLDFGMDVMSADNMGNTALHRLAGVSCAVMFTDVLEVLIDVSTNVNSKNVYGESAAFVFFLEDVFLPFVDAGMAFNARDRWGRTPLMSLMKHRPKPELLSRLIIEGKADVNFSDKHGSTPLHMAAYHNFEEQVKLLLQHGASVSAVDSLKDTPLDTVKRHTSYRCHRLLLEKLNQELLYSRSKPYEDFLLDMPKTICSSVIKTKESITETMNLPEDRSELFEFLMNTYHRRTPENASEVSRVTEDVVCLVNSLCKSVASYDERFNMSVFRTGSSEEGTKVGPPDEFDFALCVNELRNITRVVMTEECVEKGFACLKFSQSPVPEDYLPFADSEGYFLAFPFLKLYYAYLKRALNETSTWTNGNIYFNYEDKMDVINGKPVFNFEVYWIGTVYKQLKISIDLVPVIYTPGWWPKNVQFPTIPEMNEEVKNAGCFLILQTKENDFTTSNLVAGDDVYETCSNRKNEKKRRMLRVSAAPAEIALMKNLPNLLRSAYILAKIVKSKEICPKIEIDEIPSIRLMHRRAFDFKKPLPINPSHVIKSYMLKNCVFYLWLEMNSTSMENEGSTADLTGCLFQYLLEFTSNRYLNPFFLPYSDVFEFEKDDTMSLRQGLLLHMKRELSIKLILGILNQDF
jgi:ankyrin repeat protein